MNNRGTKDNDIIFVADERRGKKIDVLKSGNIDKISLLLNKIDNNVIQLRNNKRIEINKINAHNQRLNQNNKSIVFYSILELVKNNIFNIIMKMNLIIQIVMKYVLKFLEKIMLKKNGI